MPGYTPAHPYIHPIVIADILQDATTMEIQDIQAYQNTLAQHNVSIGQYADFYPPIMGAATGQQAANNTISVDIPQNYQVSNALSNQLGLENNQAQSYNSLNNQLQGLYSGGLAGAADPSQPQSNISYSFHYAAIAQAPMRFRQVQPNEAEAGQQQWFNADGKPMTTPPKFHYCNIDKVWRAYEDINAAHEEIESIELAPHHLHYYEREL